MKVEPWWHIDFDEEQILRMEGEPLSHVLSRPSGVEIGRAHV
jgi:hypothetical protein